MLSIFKIISDKNRTLKNKFILLNAHVTLSDMKNTYRVWTFYVQAAQQQILAYILGKQPSSKYRENFGNKNQWPPSNT